MAAPSSSSTTHPPLIYACVAHGSSIIFSSTPPAPFNRLSTNLLNHATHLVSLILPKISHSSTSKLTYTHQDHFLSYIATPGTTQYPQGLSYIVVSPASAGRKVPFAFLLSVQREFEDNYVSSVAEGFDGVIQREMGKFSAAVTDGGPSGSAVMASYGGVGGQDNVKKVQEEIENVRGIMTENIERVLERGERIDLLVDKTGRLNVNAGEFRRRSRGLRRRMWWKNVKVMALLIFVVVFLMYLIVGMGCGLPGRSQFIWGYIPLTYGW
ncbi:synaptobrevin-domain-containing protein [Kalaharituber pfeilii]|nr:synaptobrevin-domain-containing protein [Kalaharituber pfeilii]